MILLDNLYTIDCINTCGDCITATLRLKAGSEIYRAHFPGQPVTPGVCTIQMAVESASSALGRKLSLRAVRNAKFKAVIDPRTTPVLIYDIKVSDNLDRLKVRVSDPDGTTFADLSLTCITTD